MNLRQAAQQALDAWFRPHGINYVDFKPYMGALRAALAEPEQEPVGHADLGINNIYIFSALEPCVVPVGRTPLYTAPIPRRPLTDEEIDKLPWGPREGNPMTFAEGLRDFARAIERAHGIGEHHGS